MDDPRNNTGVLTQKVNQLRDMYISANLYDEDTLATYLNALMRAEEHVRQYGIPEVIDGKYWVRGSAGETHWNAQGQLVQTVPYHQATRETCSCSLYYSGNGKVKTHATCVHRQVVWIVS